MCRSNDGRGLLVPDLGNPLREISSKDFGDVLRAETGIAAIEDY
jgi:hypothetical protein